MSEHTPGPWEAKDGTVIRRDHDADGGATYLYDTVATMSIGVKGSPRANARLMAAAPDLLEALRDLLSVLRGEHEALGCDWSTEDNGKPSAPCVGCTAMSQARAAIESVEGSRNGAS